MVAPDPMIWMRRHPSPPEAVGGDGKPQNGGLASRRRFGRGRAAAGRMVLSGPATPLPGEHATAFAMRPPPLDEQRIAGEPPGRLCVHMDV